MDGACPQAPSVPGAPSDADVHPLLLVIAWKAVSREDRRCGVHKCVEQRGSVAVVGRQGEERPAAVVVGEEEGAVPDPDVQGLERRSRGGSRLFYDFMNGFGKFREERMALRIDDGNGS